MIPDEYLQTFVIECRELLEQMEEALLIVEQAAEDPEIINAIFRAAHTIKGSAGMFGIDHVVVFTHAAESVLDRVRSGDVSMNSVLAALFIEAHDHLKELISHVAEGSHPADETDNHGKNLITQLEAYLSEMDGTEAEQGPGSGEMPVIHQAKLEREESEAVETDLWHLSLRFGTEVFRNGMDPFSFVRCLSSLGSIVELVTIIDAIPSCEQMDPETCYLGFEISFSSEADKLAIDNVFNFVRSDCFIRILPPRSKASEYQRLIQELPEQEMRLGEILVKCGTLTPEELDSILRIQSQHGDEPQRPIGEVLVEQQMVSPPVVEAALEKQKQVKDNKKSEAQPDPRRCRKTRRTDQPGRRTDHCRSWHQPDRPARRHGRSDGIHRHAVPAGRRSPRFRTGLAHGANRRHLQPLPARGARRQQRAGQRHRPGYQRRGNRTRQNRRRKNRRPADPSGAQLHGSRHRICRAAHRPRQTGQRHAQTQRLPRCRQHRASKSATTAAA